MADREKQAAKKAAGEKKEKKPHSARNWKLPGGVWRFSQARMYKKKAHYKIKKTDPTKKEKPKRKPRTIVKPVGGDKNGGKRIVHLKKQRRHYPTEDTPNRRKSRKVVSFRKHSRSLRKNITPGTVLIMLAGRHRGKRVVFLKQLESGLLLVTGPFKVNACPLRRVNQIYVISTKTKIDLSGLEVPKHLSDKYFRRLKPKKGKKDDGEIFDTKPEEYSVSEQRKTDQVNVDKQLMDSIRKHPDKKMLIDYLKTPFSLRNHMYPHQMKF